MNFLYGFLVGAVLGGSGIGYLAYNYGKKAVAAVQAVKDAAKG